MFKDVKVKGILVVLFLLIFCSSGFLMSESAGRGNIIGFIYSEGGTTPLEGAVVQVKNMSTGIIYDSSVSDEYGIFKVQGVESGIYMYGVKTPQGNFNSDDLVGVRVSGDGTAKMSVSLTPYEEKVYSAKKEIYSEQKIAGESFVGRIVDFATPNRLADVYIVKGMIQLKDKIHTKGENTDFYQNLEDLQLDGSPAKRLFPGQTATLRLTKNAEIGDSVYLVCKKKLLPLFLTPVGIAALVAGSGAIIYKFVDLQDGETVSPSKNKK